ncbi:MAG TPA: spore coat U domain-containing protein [Gammaproteobacteria bacterium]|nr:spore coat U domain-containing protein [Gammaproteobacteria bacterium]
MHLVSFAGTCTFTSVSPVNFGNYDPFSLSNNDSAGSLTVRCTNGSPPVGGYILTLSAGNSGNYNARYLLNGTQHLNYNLYKDASRTQVWGNTGSTVVTIPANGTTTSTIYGRISPGQDVGVGNYSDILVATINF